MHLYKEKVSVVVQLIIKKKNPLLKGIISLRNKACHI